eukprot:TRINITY_DN8500_c0_g1_i1.p1 TRINITY_DN8500_c0_g1~~TRINITY_DN8500_c0_g1_i1.p1  ORF type:complete len:726 (-),score=343.41 TRINITY_DN8500_c0_g1_i1:97-2274(-)
MFHSRLHALEQIRSKVPLGGQRPAKSPVEIFEDDVFGDKELKDKLPPRTYENFKKMLNEGGHLDATVADLIAAAMKDWALQKGATHFTHWFQPLTGLTAEKHDSFISFQGEAYSKKLTMNFTGKQLIKGEPDASSFPSGGIRSTFEARGYTAWDMSSPSFIRHGTNGSFLTIPSAFASWTGEALDTKTPLLRSNDAVSKASIRILKLLGENQHKYVHSNLGVEQEFFVIDRGFYLARPDLRSAGRSVMGAAPPKGQQMEDHYFGAVEGRILSFMQDVEWRLWKLGVPTTTRHNEVAPSQYELAPIFEGVSVACDHNMVMMEVLKDTAKDHDLACLLHEKPFAGVNGSGKHNNWSLCTDTGVNLMDPGDEPHDNIRFLVFTAAVVRTISVHGDLLRASIANPGNEHRLGANEAPPAIISVFLGGWLDQVVDDIVDSKKTENSFAQKLSLGVAALPPLPKDFSDRNRTSPFAFTGNKFEFRAVGSSQSCARPVTYLNATMADSLNDLASRIEAQFAAEPKVDAIENVMKVIADYFREHRRAIFGGNGYSQEWRDEAEKRGLWHLRTLPDAAKEITSEKNTKLFGETGVFSKTELLAQQSTIYEHFSKSIQIESDCLLDMAKSGVLPVALEYREKTFKSIDVKDQIQSEYGNKISSLVSDLIKAISEHEKASEHQHGPEEDLHGHAVYCRNTLAEVMANTRSACDALEKVVDDKMWPYPKYSEMLFLK